MDIAYPKTYIAWDLETSGLDPKTCKILEIGAIRVEDGVMLERRSWMLNWGIEIPDVITSLTGITKQEIDAEGRDPKECLMEFIQFLQVGTPHLTHNGIRFDIPFLLQAIYQDGRFLSNADFFGDQYYLSEKLYSTAIDTAVLVKAKKLNMPRILFENFKQYADRVMAVKAFGVKYNVALCCQEMGIDTSETTMHRALGDVELTHKIYQHLTLPYKPC